MVYLHEEIGFQIQWNPFNPCSMGQPILDLINGGFNNRIFYDAI